MIAILSTANHDPEAPIVLRLSAGSSMDDMPVRVSRQATLDGGADVDWRGAFPGDRTMTLRANLSPGENETLARWIRDHELFTLSSEAGLFVGVIENVSGSGGARTIRFLALEKAEPPPPPPPPIGLDTGLVVTQNAGYRVTTTTVYQGDPDYAVGKLSVHLFEFGMLFALPVSSGDSIVSAHLEFARAIDSSSYTFNAQVDRAQSANPNLPGDMDAWNALSWDNGTPFAWESESEGYVYSVDVADFVVSQIAEFGWTSGDSMLLRLRATPTAYYVRHVRPLEHPSGPAPTIRIVTLFE